MNKTLAEQVEVVVSYLLREFIQGDTSRRIVGRETLIHLREDAPSIWLLLEGCAEVRLVSGEVLRVAAPSVFGEISLLSSNPAIANVDALPESLVLAISRDRLATWRREAPQSFIELITMLAGVGLARSAGAFHDNYVGLIAHDNQKPALLALCDRFKAVLKGFPIVSTWNTGCLLTQRLGLPIARHVRTGLKGGDQQIGALVASGQVRGIVFLRDPMTSHSHQADVDALVRICEVFDVPIATSRTMAVLLLEGLGRCA